MSSPLSDREGAAGALPELFDELPAGCLTVDAQGIVLQANDTLGAWLGIDAAALAGRKFADLLTIGGKLYYAHTHQVREQVSGEVQEISYDLKHADGSTVPVLVSTRSLPDGTTLYLAFKARMRRRYEAQLLDAKKASEESNRARKTFINTITHEVRTPIHAVLGIADLLRGTPLDKTQTQLIDILADSAGALLGLVNDVLDLSRAESSSLRVDPKPTELTHLVDAVTASLRPTLLSEAVELRSVVAASCPSWVLVDAGKLRQILTNLVANAIKFTERGHVELSVNCRGPVSGADDRIALEFAVEDTGPGIAAHEQATVFAPFGQASSTIAGGTGLGLTISQRIARALGAEITLDSQLGHGSTFSFTLALRETSRLATPVPPDQEDEKQTGRLRGLAVLVVDDNSTNRFIARRHLARLGVESVEAASGAEAIALARERPFDLVMLDLRMPEMNGFETATHLRALPTCSATPLLAVTAASYPDDRDRDEEAQFAGRLLKPYTLAQLRTALLDHLPDGQAVSAPDSPSMQPSPDRSTESEDELSQPATIDRDSILAEFGADETTEDLVEFLGFAKDDLLAERAALVGGTRTGDTQTVRSSRHKLMPILGLVGPRPLVGLLEEAIAEDYSGNRARLADRLDAALTAATHLIDAYAAEVRAQ